jgi:hypothetical protein
MEDGKLGGFYGSSLALILWLFIPIILPYIVLIFTSIFAISDFVLNILVIITHLAIEILLIVLFYTQKLRVLLISLIIMFIVGYVIPLAIGISVEWGYMASWGSVMRLILDFLLNIVVVIIISTISGMFGGWIGRNLPIKHQEENLDYKE